MDKKAEIDGRTYADNKVFPSHNLDVAFSQKTLSRAHKHMRVLRTKDGARVYYFQVMKVIFVFSLVASVGKYAFRKQNAYLFIDCSIENGIASVYWRGREW